MACSYCDQHQFNNIENTKIQNKLNKEEVISFIDSFIDEPKLTLHFYGGEPLLNFTFIKDVILHYDNNNINFGITTNGLALDNLLNEFLDIQILLNERKQNLFFKISYDGKLNNSLRVLKNKLPSTDKVVSNIKLYQKNNFKIKIHPTVTFSGFENMFDAFAEFKNEFNIPYNPGIDNNIGISHTLGYLHYLTLKESLIKIAIYIFNNNLDTSMFGWFTENRNTCGAGKHLISVDTNGKVSPCMALPINDSNLIMGSIKSNVIDIKKKMKWFDNTFKNKCDECDVNYCLKCPAKDYELSNRNDSLEKWYNSGINGSICGIFKISGIVFEKLLLAQESNDISLIYVSEDEIKSILNKEGIL